MKTVSTLPILFVTILLGGCMATFTPKQNLEQFNVGESKSYILVSATNKDLTKISCNDESRGKEFLTYVSKEICPNLKNLQIVGGYYHNNPLAIYGIKVISAYAPLSANIEKDDIVELSVLIQEDGSLARPALFSRVARKAKDTGPDCRWEGGKGATSAFMSGGVVCDGWDWKKQKFAK